MVAAADVFCYFGDLEEIFKLCLPQKLIFSFETNLQTESFILQANGRYQHNPQYIEKLLKVAGYTNINFVSAVLRNEGETEVVGAICSAS